MLQIARVTAFTISKLLNANQQWAEGQGGGVGVKLHSPTRVEGYIWYIFIIIIISNISNHSKLRDFQKYINFKTIKDFIDYDGLYILYQPTNRSSK